MVQINELIGLNLNTTFKISLTGHVFAVPTTSSASLIGSDVILRIVTSYWLIH